MSMHFGRGHISRVLILFIVFWAALAITIGAFNKSEADLGAGTNDSAAEISLKMCAVIFTAIAAAAGGVSNELWLRLPVGRSGMSRLSPPGIRHRYRPPPHGLALLRRLQIMLV